MTYTTNAMCRYLDTITRVQPSAIRESCQRKALYPTARRNWGPFGGGRGLARSPHQNSRVEYSFYINQSYESLRPKRLRKERVPWEAAVIPTLGTANSQKS